MIPKIIHLCWFSNDPFPVEIRICLDSWKRWLPDYTVRRWTYDDAKAIGCKFIDEALAVKKYAFAADVVRFYALYSEGGIYMDSDIFIKCRFDKFIPTHGFATFHEVINKKILLQAAFLIGEKGNNFCGDVLKYYNEHSFINPDGTYNQTISPKVMVTVANNIEGYCADDVEQHLPGDIIIYPNRYVMPRKKDIMSSDAFAQHRIYGSWRKRKFGRRIELIIKHQITLARYFLLKR